MRADTPFTGSFEGLGNAITGLTINDASDSYVGLFAQIGAGGQVTQAEHRVLGGEGLEQRGRAMDCLADARVGSASAEVPIERGPNLLDRGSRVAPALAGTAR